MKSQLLFWAILGTADFYISLPDWKSNIHDKKPIFYQSSARGKIEECSIFQKIDALWSTNLFYSLNPYVHFDIMTRILEGTYEKYFLHWILHSLKFSFFLDIVGTPSHLGSFSLSINSWLILAVIYLYMINILSMQEQ